MKLKATIEVGVTESHLYWNGKHVKLPTSAHDALVEAYQDEQVRQVDLVIDALHGRPYTLERVQEVFG